MKPEHAIPRQQTEAELRRSEWHSRLDTVLRYLQGIGYTLLNDAEPVPGGGVRLRQSPSRRAPWVDNPKSAKIPNEKPTEQSRSLPGVDDDQVMREMAASLGPSLTKYALFKDDLVLVTRFASRLATVSPAATDKVKHETFYKTVLQGIRLMHQCDFDYSDIVVTMAYASIYFRSTFQEIGHMMTEVEAAHVCTLLIFLAHSFVLDETCPLRCWQRHVFRRYCSLKVLDAALFRLFNLRGFRLQLNQNEEEDALQALLGPNALADLLRDPEAMRKLKARGRVVAAGGPDPVQGHVRFSRCPSCHFMWHLPEPPNGICTRCPGGIMVVYEEEEGDASSGAAKSSHEPHAAASNGARDPYKGGLHKPHRESRNGHSRKHQPAQGAA